MDKEEKFSQKFLDYIKRDQELKLEQIKQNKDQLRFNKRKAIIYMFIFGLPALLYALVLGNVLKTNILTGDYAALVSINGVIDASKPASSERVVPAINSAFDDDDAVGVIIKINSPGGSPVQADLIHQAIKRKIKEYPNKPVYVVVEDMCASGGYWIASAVNEIYANESSVIGSIGVISQTFGLDLNHYLNKFGIERRTLTAGIKKDFGDPFSPMSETYITKTHEVLDDIHKVFKRRVLSTRSEKFTIDPEQIFTGEFWTGEKALKIGLIDGYGSLSTILKDKLNVSVVSDHSPKTGFFDKMSSSLGTSSLYLDIISSISTERYFAF